AQALMKQKAAPAYASTMAERLKRMDEQGIDMQALSINPTWYALDRDLVTKVIELQNEKLAELCAKTPDRFVAFASVALQYPDLAVRQLEHGVKKLGLRCAAHGGGYLPSYAGRSDHVCLTFPERCSAVLLKKTPTEYLKQLYFDSLVFTPEALRHLAAQVGASQLVIGTDDPFGWTKTAVDHILGTPELTDEQRAAILGLTAAKLLGISL